MDLLWPAVEVDSARMGEVLEALRAGRFYGSSGLELAAYETTESVVSLELANADATIELIGEDGAVLDADTGQRARFSLGAIHSSYVRVRATAPDDRKLWMQPIFR